MLDLAALVSRVESGESTSKIEREIEALEQDYRRTAAAGEGSRQLLARHVDLDRQLRSLQQRLLRSETPAWVADVGRVATAAARLISDKRGGVTAEVIGRILLVLEDPTEAARSFEWAARLFGCESLPGVGADSSRLSSLADARQAMKVCQDAPVIVARARAYGSDGLAVKTLYVWTRAEIQRGRHEAALLRATDAVTLARDLPREQLASNDAPPLESLWLVRGKIARDTGRFDEAFTAFERSRELALETGEQRAAAYALSEIGFAWFVAGDPERGNRFLRQAAREATELGWEEKASHWSPDGGATLAGLSSAEGSVRLAHAMKLAAAGGEEIDRARETILEVIASAKEKRQPDLEAAARNCLGALYSRQDRDFQAAAAYQEAIRVAEQSGMRDQEFHYRTNLANLWLQRGRLGELFEEVGRAIELGERLRKEAESTEMRQTVSAALARAYEQLAPAITGTAHHPDGSVTPPQPERLFELSQRSRALNLGNWFGLAEIVESAGSEALAREHRRLRGIELEIEATAQQERPLGALGRARQDAADRFRATARAAGLEVEGGFQPLQQEQVAACLEPGEVVVDLFSAHDGFCVNVFGSSGWRAIDWVQGKREERSSLLRRWTISVRALQRCLLSAQESEMERARERLRGVHSELREQLILPIVEELEPLEGLDRLILLPHRELLQVPFWLLEEELPGTAISVLPSVAALFLLKRRRRDGGGDRIYCGDATGTLPYSSRATSALAGFERISLDLEELPARLEGGRLIHVAGHGHFNEENPYRSGIVGEPPDGGALDPLNELDPWGLGHEMITVGWIVAKLHLPRCELAVLSACYTGLPRIHAASEFTSLPAAFLIAGSRSVVASLWPVHDGATLLLMEEFYRALDEAPSDGGLGPSRALARARRRLAAISRTEVLERLGDDFGVPPGEHPFRHRVFTDSFQVYGPD